MGQQNAVPTERRRWWERCKQRKGTIGVLAGITTLFWNLERIIGLADVPENIGQWWQGILAVIGEIPEWAYKLGEYSAVAGVTLLTLFVVLMAEDYWNRIKTGDFWTSHRWFFWWGLRRLRNAARNLGWVKVRYGMVQGNVIKHELWSRSRRMWKGKAEQIVFSSGVYGSALSCFIEFPDTYHAIIISLSDCPWHGCYPASSPGYRRYESDIPSSLRYTVATGSHVASITVGTDDRGAGGYGAAWGDIRRGFRAVLRGKVEAGI